MTPRKVLSTFVSPLLLLALAPLSGCFAGAAGAALPIAMTATQGIAMAHAQAVSKDQEASGGDEAEERCEQLLHAPPGIEEIRRRSDGSLESREIRLDLSGEKGTWVPYREKGTSAEGWRAQSTIARLNFSPPLYGAIPEKDSRFMVYAKTVAETPQDSDQMVSVAEQSGKRTGTFKWRGKSYNYTLIDKLPCFAGPD